MRNLLIGGAAGDGIETMAGLLEKILMRSGYFLFSMRDFMSRVRGGHNFALLRFGADPVHAHRQGLDGLVVFNEESYAMHEAELLEDAFVLCDQSFAVDGEKVIKLDLFGMAKAAGNAKAAGVVCIGALLKLFGIPIAGVDDVLAKELKPSILEANQKALRLGYDAAQPKFSETAGKLPPDIGLYTGAEAMALGALAGGMNFYAAYPMSPSTTLLSFFMAQAKPFQIAVEQAEDEIAAINMALGASYAGARAMVGTSGGGFSLMVEGLGFAGIAELPVVIADIQRPGPATGLPTRTEQSDLLFVTTAAQGEFPRMVIAVRDHRDAFLQAARAQYLAAKYQIPVLLLSDQYLADAAATLPIREVGKAAEDWGGGAKRAAEAEGYVRYAPAEDGVSPLLWPGEARVPVRIDSDEHDATGVITESAEVRTDMVDKRAAKTEALRQELQEPTVYGAEAPELLLLGFGTTARVLEETVAMLQEGGEISAAALCFGDVFPLPTKTLEAYAAKAKRILTVEQNETGQLARLIRQETGIACDDSILKYDGRQISADQVIMALDGLELEKE